MAQITLYVDEDTAEKIKAAARAEGVSRSRWVGELIRQRVNDEWPQAVVELAGAWPDAPAAESLRATAGKDVDREKL